MAPLPQPLRDDVQAEDDGPAAPPRPLPRILIVDDSAVTRAVMERIVTASGRYVVVASVSTIAAGLAALARERIDLILLDINLPDTDGLTALPALLAASNAAHVLVVSGALNTGGDVAQQALDAGAIDTLFKPEAGQRITQFSESLLGKIDRLLAVDSAPATIDEHSPAIAIRTSAAVRDAKGVTVPLATAAADYDVVAIGASTGGIHALSELLRAIPAEFRLPILVTQHLPAAFMPYFAAQLAVIGGRPCEVAYDRMRVRPGRIIVAPGDAHMRCVRLPDGSAAVRLTDQPSDSGCMPSVDPMLASLADIFGPRVLAIVLSGMGRDGADGARSVHEAGGSVIVQDRISSVVWGMPGTIVQAGHADVVLSPRDIGLFAAAGQRP